MSHLLWKSYYDDNVDKFRRLLAPAGYTAQSASKSPNIGAGGAGSPGAFGTSPRNVAKARKASGFGPGAGNARSGNTNFGRAEVNSRDHVGLTILLRAASSTSENAIAFVEILLDHPAIDIYVQDPESGWNALHRALYIGNISIARLLLDKERRDLTGLTLGAPIAKAGRLIKTKDHEGNSPFDLYNSTIGERDLKGLDDVENSDDDSESEEIAISQDPISSRGPVELDGTEVFAFGSNKNLSLGLGDEDDRQFPERVYLERPAHLIERFYNDYIETTGAELSGEIPTLTRNKDLLVHDVVLSKYHSAMLTTDEVSNLYVCGVGRGGRLGLGDENTRFTYTPVQGGLVNKKVIQVALGQNHTMAVTDAGEVWTWGSNTFSQLGYTLPEPPKGDEPVCLSPRQVFGPLKKEAVFGVAASTIHSVAYTNSSLWVWGKNAGQLALMDADSRSLEVQQSPRKVAASLLTAGIIMVSAIDKATTCLLENHTVVVFTSYGYNIVKFPLAEGAFTRHQLGRISISSRYDVQRNQINYITSGGDTIVGVSGRGDLFSMSLTQKGDAQTSTSTTNPSKIKGAVSQPVCIWSAHKDGVRSVDVGEHGSVIISTQSGAVWRRVKRAKAKDTYVAGSSEVKRKDFKFQRVPGITNIVTVRSSIFGAFAAVRKDSEVMREQVIVGQQTLWDDVAPLNCLRDFKSFEPTEKEKLKFWSDASLQARLGSVAYEVLKSPDLEADLQNYLSTWHRRHNDLDGAICTTSSPDLKIPVHGWILSARSPALRRALAAVRSNGDHGPPLPDQFNVEVVDGKTVLTLVGVDVISMLNIVLYMYEDRVIPAWNYTRHEPSLAFRYRQIRAEVVKLASQLGMGKLEAAAQRQVDPQRSLDQDLRSAVEDPQFFDDADALLELDGEDMLGHSALLCQRCPFFEGLFHGRSQGMWIASRRTTLGASERIPIDLKHMEPETFKFVLRHLYGDVGSDLFDDMVSDSLEEFLDIVMDVLSVANELMLDRLSQICQQVIARFINTRNIAHFLNAISPCSITEFKDAGLEYITLQMEDMLENHLLDDLDSELLEELDEVVRDNQLARYPFAKSGRAEMLLHEQYPELAQDIDEERQRRVKEMAFRANQRDEEKKLSSSLKAKFGSLEEFSPLSPALDKPRSKAKAGRNEPFSPDLRPKAAQPDLMFNMDDDEGQVDSPSIRPKKSQDMRRQSDLDQIPPLSGSYRDEKGKSVYRSLVLSPPAGTSIASSQEMCIQKSGQPWASAKLPTDKLDLREIMHEASPAHSALSAGIAAQKAKEASARPQQPRLSQKERKRQQQLQAEQAALTPSVKTAWEKSSPWQTVTNGSKPSPQDVLTEAPKKALPSTKSLVAAEGSTQSIPRRTQSPDTRHSGQSRTPAKTPPVRPSPKPTSSMSNFSADMSSKPVVPHSKSYIKPAPKAEPTLGLSMADIIDQERRNLESVKEAVAKRSLEEIQQEQAFQEWWEEESRRTQEEEARRSTRDRDRENEKGARGRRGRGGKARGC
ncbi:BTB/POZ domain-containing protein 1 [Cytospora mali]|uniref:BTB/POZ domain-containing protein 1 n=1 Tax=Cytospora mali TaxID=578113 RepID=A0A194W1J0_CYTMA|nr:BTB/POZ domain-containing protein 1 [Valsa mali]